MNSIAVSPETPVSDVLLASHEAISVFQKYRTACVGCYLARFCTLRDAARTYGASPEGFMVEIQQAVMAGPLPRPGVQNEKSF